MYSFRSAEFAIHYRQVEETEVTGTSDTLSMFRMLVGDEDIEAGNGLLLGFHQHRAAYRALDVDVPVTRAEAPVMGWIRLSLISPLGLNTLTAVGHGTVLDDLGLAFYLQYTGARAETGFGWAAGGRVVYETPRFTVTLDGFDVFGELTWHRTEVRTGITNTRTETVTPDGYFSLAPFARGTKTYEERSTRPGALWIATFTPKSAGSFAGLSIESHRALGMRITSYFPLTPDLKLAVAIGGTPTAFGLGFGYKTWEISVSASRLNLTESTSIGFRLTKRW